MKHPFAMHGLALKTREVLKVGRVRANWAWPCSDSVNPSANAETTATVTINLQANVTLSKIGDHTLLKLEGVFDIPKLTVRKDDDSSEQRVAIKRAPNSEPNTFNRIIRLEKAELVLENIILEGGILQGEHDGGAIEAKSGPTRLVLLSCLVTGK